MAPWGDDGAMSRRGWLLFALMGLVWGIPYLLIKVAVAEIEPPVLVFLRTALGAAILLPIAALRHEIVPTLRRWRPLVVFAVIEICIPWVALGFAEQRISSSLTGLLIAGVPLVAAVLSRVVLKEPMRRRRVVGLLVGAAGVAAVMGFDVGSGNPVAIGAILAVVICYAVGPIIQAKYLDGLPDFGPVACALAVAAVVYLPFAIFQWPGAVSLPVAGSVVALAVICTALAFVGFFALVREVGPARAPVITYINPVVATALGVTILGEPLSWTMAGGFVLILAGSLLATSREKIRTESTPGDCPGVVEGGAEETTTERAATARP